MQKVIGIRREDKNEFECRVPITPEHVRQIVDSGISVKVQPSTIRVFKNHEYSDAGAEVTEDLSGCNAVFAVKEIPKAFFQKGGTYVFFSHVIKGQKQNMPMLRRMMDLKCNLLDYERVVDQNNRRLIFFGRHAGLAGMFDTLWALGMRLKDRGIDNPFYEVHQARKYDSLEDGRKGMKVVAELIKNDGLPNQVVPCIIGITGYGNVSKGAQEILDILPTIEIAPGEVVGLKENNPSSHHVYKVVFKEEDMVEPKDSGNAFALQDYYDHPEKYEGVFDRYTPHLTAIVNCVYWDERYPRLLTKEQTRKLYSKKIKFPLPVVVGDISCDINGSIEATVKSTDPGNPIFVYNPETDTASDGHGGTGLLVMAIDTLPSEIPREASEHFSSLISSYVPQILDAEWSGSIEETSLPYELKRAVILHKGELTLEYGYIKKFLEAQE